MASSTPDILKKIIATKKTEIELDRSRIPEWESGIKDIPQPIDVKTVLSEPGLSVIAEIKKASPSAGIIARDFNPEAFADAYHSAGASAISILTDETYFQGKLEYISQVRKQLPETAILRKDFIIDHCQVLAARAYGADTYLLIAAVLEKNQLHDLIVYGRELGMEPLVEVHNQEELEKTIACDAMIIGVNNRNLHNFEVTLQTSENLFPLIPDTVVTVAESGIRTPEDAQFLYNIGYSAILVGESLMRAGIDGCKKMITEFKKGEL